MNLKSVLFGASLCSMFFTGCLSDGSSVESSSESSVVGTSSGVVVGANGSLSGASSALIISPNSSTILASSQSNTNELNVSTASVRSDGSFYGILSAKETIVFVAAEVFPESGFEISSKEGIFVANNNRLEFTKKSKSVDLFAIELVVKAKQGAVICNGEHSILVKAFGESDFTRSSPIIKDTIPYLYRDGVDCPNGELVVPVSKLVFSDTLKLGSWQSAAPSSVDADNMSAHLQAAATAIQGDIDFIFSNEVEGEFFFYSPAQAAKGGQFTAKWTTKNETKFVKIDKNIASILNQAELKALWDNTSRADQKTPALKDGDVILLETNKRKMVAIKVIELVDASGKSTALVIGTLGDKASTSSAWVH